MSTNSKNENGHDNTTNYPRHKAYQELTFTDDYMFCRIMQSEPELCRRLIELLLCRPIAKVEYIDSQHVLSIDSDIKSVRFDVYLKDEAGTVIDLEMQVSRKPELPRRSRYYQSINDIDHLGAGMEYEQLPESYVIFICLFDPFNKNLPRYEFRELCTDDTTIALDDGTYKVFINADYKQDDIPIEMRALFDYLCGKEPDSDLTRDIAESIARAKKNRKWEREYVQFIEKMMEERNIGRAEAWDESARLFAFAKETGRLDEYGQAFEDEAVRQKLLADMQEYEHRS
ncbi:MAG: Rpn family recombination-promoting nuclease/putative transposase [Mogibacterium sp.]|nr:Rpn family recombination-promoting nuclease/putative transposase [Mogibacterium sp.]